MLPSADVLFASVHGRVYCATRGAAKEERMISGYGGTDEAPSSISIRDAGVDVETMLEPYPQPPEVFEESIIVEAIAHAIATRDLTFPLTLTVERLKQKIPVDGHDRVFTTYTCGHALRAIASVDELHLRLRCHVAEFQRGFAIRSLTQAEPKRLVEEHPAYHRWADRIYGVHWRVLVGLRFPFPVARHIENAGSRGFHHCSGCLEAWRSPSASSRKAA